MSDVFVFLVQRFTKTKLKKSSFPLKVSFKDVLNHTCILSKHHLEIILHYLNSRQSEEPKKLCWHFLVHFGIHAKSVP